MSRRKCGRCGHDPACGYASVYANGVETWYCHDDECAGCYEAAQTIGAVSAFIDAVKEATS